MHFLYISCDTLCLLILFSFLTGHTSSGANIKHSHILSHWKNWCWSWNSNTLATWCEELTHWKRPWCWERLKAGGEGDDRGWDDWMTSPTQWTWVWVNHQCWWWIGRPGVLWSLVVQKVRHDWVTELNWTEHMLIVMWNDLPNTFYCCFTFLNGCE